MKNCVNCGSELSDYATVCSVCGSSVSDAVQPSSVYDVPAKKSKKGLLFGLIGGGIAIILIIACCFLFCCGSIEFGMDIEDSQSVMESEGFFCLGHYLGINSASSGYEGEIDDLSGRSEVELEFNENDALYRIIITPFNCDVTTAKSFMESKLNVTFDEYTAQDYYYDDGDEVYTDVARLVARNEKYIVIINEYCNYEKKDGTQINISIYCLEHIHESDLEDAEERIEEIKDEDSDYDY
ncbi:MAG: hypothetical protein IKJ55_05820 [Clostridia bacterium]|nr:hypothetical protein [Clostridia bacterium]